jgi:O-antigen/teichoic acid export membrane protein
MTDDHQKKDSPPTDTTDPVQKEPGLTTEGSADGNDAAVVGRGFLVITGAKVWFMVGGTAITFGLPFIFDLFSDNGRALYGQYYDLNNILSILSMVMVTGVMQTVAKFVAERPESPGGIVRQARKMMLFVGGLVGGGFFLAAPWIADARNNPGLVNGYRAAGLILFCYGIYTVYIGTLNGQKRFRQQAMFDIGFTTLKVSLVLGMAAIGLGVLGAFYGFAMAAAIIMLVAVIYVSKGVAEGEPQPSLYKFAGQVMLYTLVFNLIFKLDGVLIKPAIIALFAQGAGWTAEMGDAVVWLSQQADAVRLEISQKSDALMANYGMAVNVSRLPWQATIAITFVIFPMVSEATFSQDRDRTQLYIRQTMRYSMILVGAAVVVLMALPDAIFRILPSGYESGAIALLWLAPAYFSFSLFNIVNTLLMSSGRAGTALAVGVITVIIAVLLYWQVLPQAGTPDELLRMASQSTCIAFTLGLLLGLGALWRNFGPPIPPLTLIRVAAVMVALIFGGTLLPEMGRIASLAVAVVVGLSFLVGLLVTGEFGAEDRERFMRIIGRRKP